MASAQEFRLVDFQVVQVVQLILLSIQCGLVLLLVVLSLSHCGGGCRILQERRHAGTWAFQVPLPSILSSRKLAVVTTRHRSNPNSASAVSLTTHSSLLREYSHTEPVVLNRYGDDNSQLVYEYSLL